jgi:hypothetical protein
MTDFKRGDQIVYIPQHAKGDPGHADCEHGFISCIDDDGAIYCRYFSKTNIGILRTRANSEATPLGGLIHSPASLIPQEVVDAWLTIIEWENS